MADHIVDNNVLANAIVILYLLQTTHDAPRCDSDPVPVDNQAAERDDRTDRVHARSGIMERAACITGS